jgi:UPF0755 protein
MTDAPEMFSKRKEALGSRLGLISLMVAGVLIVGILGLGWWLVTRTEHPVKEGQQVEVPIPAGASTEQIGRMLADYGVINNSLMFEIKAKLGGKSLRSGTYELATGMPDELVLDRLGKGPQIVYYDIPIPEGFTAKQVAKRFAARAGVSQDEMMSLVTSGAAQFASKHPYLANAYGDSLEGYLFPATYRIKKGTKPADIIEMMLQKFDQSTVGIDYSYAQSKGFSPSDVLTIASILEREAKLAKDRPVVASVIYNRVAAHMRLQLDSTVFYVVPEGTAKLTNADLFNMSPYNTYRHSGLPPGPICNPGTETLQAAAHPSQTKYMYYVLTSKDGSQTFTVTYKDFLVAVKKYHQVFGQ